MTKKMRVGFFSFTCCEGCTIAFIEILNKKYEEYVKALDIVYLRALKKDTEIVDMDIAFVEGAIATESEIERLKKIREKATKIVAFGSAAMNGWPSNLRNNFNEEQKKLIEERLNISKQKETVEPIKTYIKVDDQIPGCPIEENIFIKKMEGYLEEHARH